MVLWALGFLETYWALTTIMEEPNSTTTPNTSVPGFDEPFMQFMKQQLDKKTKSLLANNIYGFIS